MRNLMFFAAVMIGLGVYMAQQANAIKAAPSQAQPQQQRAFAATQPQANPKMVVSQNTRSVSLAKDGRGHFSADARVDGRNISVMVDTGASVVALNESTAARIGFRPSRSDYTANVSTANGSVKAARTRLASVDIGGVVVRDVEALVLPDSALSENLLGMAYLSRLKRFEYANGRLVLEQ
ncbi:MAG: peptidase [Proteobacteria bacterium SG_bin9]|nr:MAG: peptidase [Proteobacteria bacterium SG_bin9]